MYYLQPFPFEIEYIPKSSAATLKREYEDELIKVSVYMPDDNENDDDEDSDIDSDSDSDDDDENEKRSITLFVTVSKNGGPSLTFRCAAFPDEIEIDFLTIRNHQLEGERSYADIDGRNFR